jgi:hypothetical protein
LNDVGKRGEKKYIGSHMRSSFTYEPSHVR